MDEWSNYKYDQARAWLEHVRDLGKSAERARLMAEDDRARLENVRGIDYTREHVAGNAHIQDMDFLIEHLYRSIREYCATESTYVRERKDAYDRLALLENNTERDALTLRYCMGHPWEYIEGLMDYSHIRMMEIHKSGITHAYDVMPTEWRDPLPPAV